MTNQLVERGYLTQSLGSASHSGEHGFKAVPGLLKLVLENRAWEQRIIVETGEEFKGFASFDDYVRANPPKGLGSDIITIKRLVADNQEVLDLLEKTRGTHQGKRIDVSTSHDSHEVDTNKRNRSDQLRRKLREEHAELYEQVLHGKMTITEAAVEAKIYPPRIAVNLRDAKSAAATLTSHAPPEFIEALKRLL